MQGRQYVPAFLALVLVSLTLFVVPAAGTPVLVGIDGNVSTAQTTFHIQSDVWSPVKTNTTTNYSVNVTNIGNRTDSLAVTLTVDNTTVDNTTVQLAPHNNTIVTLTTNYSTEQEYNVSFNSLEPVSIYGSSCIGPMYICGAVDPDDDGRYEDVNGDGAVNIIDVGALLANRDSQIIERNVDRYDFNNDGQVNIIDVGKLLSEVTS